MPGLTWGPTVSDRGDGSIAQWATGGVCDSHVDGLCTTASLQSAPAATIYNFNTNGVCEDSGVRFENTGVDSVEQGAYYMCEFRGGNTVNAYCSNRMTADGVVDGALNRFWYPCGHGTDCTDCGTRCGTGSNPYAASILTSLVPSAKIMFIPAAMSMSYLQTKRVIIQLRDALEPFEMGRFKYVTLQFSTTVPGLTITPPSVSWSGMDNYTVARAITLAATQPISATLANVITVTLNTNDVGYYGYPPTFLAAVAATSSPPPPPGNPPGLPPMATFPTGCTIQQAWTRRMTIDQCYAYYYQYNLQDYGPFIAAEGNLTNLEPALYHLGICYWDGAGRTMQFRSARYLQACMTQTCFCPSTSYPPPPPPPGQCGIDHCDGCLNPQPENVGGYCIAPGNCNCSPDGPNRCWYQQGSTCVLNAQRRQYCCTEI